MTTIPVMTVNAPSQATRDTFLVAAKNKALRVANNARGWVYDMSRRSGLDRAWGFARRYLYKAYNFGRAVVNAAGAIPLAILAATSHTGQKMIKGAVSAAWNVASWIGRKVYGAVTWFIRLFGAPGRNLAAGMDKSLASAKSFCRTNWKKACAVATPYLSPDRVYMRAAKAVSYAIVAAGLIGTFVTGVWVIPAYAAAAGFGLLSIPEVRRSALVTGMIGAFEDEQLTKARRSVAEYMESLIAEYGPDMDTWSTAARADYQVKKAIYNYLDGDRNAFKGLSGNQRKRAEKWLHEFQTSVEALEHGAEGVSGIIPSIVDPETGKIVLEPEPIA